MIPADLDACLRLISERERRFVIQVLRSEVDGATTVDDLADRLYASEPVTVTTGRTGRNQLYVQLVHTHLPKLAGHGVIDYDVERGSVEYTPDEQLEAVLDSLPEEVPQISLG